MLHEVAEGHELGDVERALHLVHGFEPPRALGIGDGNGQAAVVRAAELALGGRVERVQGEAVCFEPAAQFAHLRRGAVIKMHARTENLDLREARAGDFFEQGCVQPAFDKEVSGEHALHGYPQ